MEGQVAIVTGGTRGIGLAIARLLVMRKVTVCVIGRDEQQGHLAVKNITEGEADSSVIFKTCDVTDEKQLAELFQEIHETFGRLDILVNNAGFLNEGKRSSMIGANFLAVIQGTELGLKYMSTQNGGEGGTIINVSSIGGLMLNPAAPVYGATKAATLEYTRSLGKTSVISHGVRINCLCPGITDTGFLDMTESNLYGPPGILTKVQKMLEHTPLLTADTVAAAVMTSLADTSISGAAILCSQNHPYTVMSLPENLQDIEKMYT